jgi:hypothetical protein
VFPLKELLLQEVYNLKIFFSSYILSTFYKLFRKKTQKSYKTKKQNDYILKIKKVIKMKWKTY